MRSKFDLANITYGQLHNALTVLGFDHEATDSYTAYRDATHDAIIALPLMKQDVLVSDPHLVAITNTIIGKGIASQDTFYGLLTHLENASAVDALARLVPLSKLKNS